MPYIVVGFSTKNNSVLGCLTRYFTRWRHSHVVLISEDRQALIEATDQGGVREMPISYLLQRDSVEIRKIFHPFPTAVWLHAKTQLGKPYDETASWGYLFHRDWQDENAWYCSELIEYAARKAGWGFFPSGVGCITPRDLYLISEDFK